MSDFAEFLKDRADRCGMTMSEYANAYNRLTPEQVAKAMERLPTDVLEFAVKFEALEHREPLRGPKGER